MKKKKKLSLQFKIYLLVVLSVVATTSILTYVSTKSIIKDKKAYIYDFIYSNTEVTSIIMGQFIQDSIQSVQSIVEQLEEIESEDDAEKVIEPIFINNQDLFEFSVIQPEPDKGDIKRLLTRYSYSHFSKLAEFYHLLLKTDAKSFPEYVLSTEAGKKNLDILFSKGAAPRFVYSIKSTSSNKIFVFKFSLQSILEKAFSSDTFEYALAKKNGDIVISSKSEILNGNINDFMNDSSSVPINTSAVSSTLVREASQTINGKTEKVILGVQKIKEINTFLTTGMRSNVAFRVTNLIVTKVILIFFIILACCSLVAFLMAKAITRPLENLVSATEIIASGKYEHRLEIHAGDELQALSQSFNLMIEKVNEYNQKLMEANLYLEDKVKERTRDLQDANDFIKAVLESIDQGLFIFNKKGTILEVNNRRFRDIWNVDPTDMKMHQLFPEMDPEVIKMWLRNLFEERLEFESIIKLGPTTAEFKGRDTLTHVDIAYFPMRNQKGKIENVIGIASDKTEKVAFEKQLAINTAKVNSILSITSQREEYQAYVLETMESFNSLKVLLNRPELDIEKAAPEVMRHFHSIKGNSGVFSLSDISTMAHHCENMVQEKMKTPGELDLATLKTASDQLEKTFNRSLKDNQKVSGLKMDRVNERTVELKLSTLISFLKFLRSTGSEPLIQKYSSLFLRRPAKETFARFSEAVYEISEKLHRKVHHFTIHGEETAIHKFFYQKFFNELIHVFRNIADHANQNPEERTQLGKNEGIAIDIHISVLAGDDRPYLKVEIKDDGKGIDPNIVRSRLKANGAAEEILKKSDDKIIEHIFDPSFSTSTKVTEYSGRGVGLSAVKIAVEQLKGKLSVESKVDQGTTFTFILPYA